MKVRYDGPYWAVTVPAADVTCRRGETVDVPAEIARGLLKQDGWSEPKRRTKADDKDGS